MKIDLTEMDPACTFGEMSEEEQAELEREYIDYVQQRHEMELALAEGRVTQEEFDQFTDDFK